MSLFISFLSGLLFAIGLGVSGMTQPQKIIGFLDVFGNWDPSLMFVMVGAIAVHSVSYFLIDLKGSPLLNDSYAVPTGGQITKSLIVGSFIFGVGWGVSGFCPGPGVVSLFSGNKISFNFVLSMIMGMAIHRLLMKEKTEQ